MFLRLAARRTLHVLPMNERKWTTSSLVVHVVLLQNVNYFIGGYCGVYEFSFSTDYWRENEINRGAASGLGVGSTSTKKSGYKLSTELHGIECTQGPLFMCMYTQFPFMRIGYHLTIDDRAVGKFVGKLELEQLKL